MILSPMAWNGSATATLWASPGPILTPWSRLANMLVFRGKRSLASFAERRWTWRTADGETLLWMFLEVGARFRLKLMSPSELVTRSALLGRWKG